MISRIGKIRSRSVGFTFIELLFVVIIIAILISVAIPNFRNTFANLQLKNTAWEIYTLLEYAKDRAAIEQKRFRFNLDKNSKKFWLSFRTEDEFLEIKTQLMRKRKIPDTIDVSCLDETIEFYPDGSIDGGNITLTNQLNKAIKLKKNVYGYKIEE